MVVIACSSLDSKGDAAKLQEFERMQRMHQQQTEDTENTINQSAGGFSSGSPSPQGQRPSLSVPLCSSLGSSAAGYGPRISASPRGAMPSSWTCSAAPQVGLNLSLTKTLGFPDQCPPRSRLLSPPLPRIDGSALPPGGLPCQRPISFQSPPNIVSPSSPIRSFPRLSTTVDTSPSASVGFLAAGGVPSTGSPYHTGAVPSSNSRNPVSLRLI